MRHVIIGTAGHVDHGKTTLVKALTGIDTDRLDEEKRRGVTIEPGFAYLDFEDGSRAGIIDVPGHERFIRNMLAGSGGIDLSMLIVAADEGVMPQTREHLGILTQLGIKDGLIALTKIDRVDEEWIELVLDDIAQLVKGTFLENKPILHVSAKTGDGVDELKSALLEMQNSLSEKDEDLPFRLPIDRVFSVEGFGIVVTGTLIEGSVSLGEVAEIMPQELKATVRNIQVHGENVETAYAGQRTAISLAGLKKGNITRGDVLAAESTLGVTGAIDVKLKVLPDTIRKIKNGAEVHFFHGARSMLAKVFLYDKREIEKSESAYARLKLTEPLPCKRGDRFVVRFLSPLETLGGGIILDSNPAGRVYRDEKMLKNLEVCENGNTAELGELFASKLAGVFTESDLSKRSDMDKKTTADVLERLIDCKKVIKLYQNRYISVISLKQLEDACSEILSKYHDENPLRIGMNIAELRQKLLPDAETSDASAVLLSIEENGKIIQVGNNVHLSGFVPKFSVVQEKIKDKIIKTLKVANYEVPSIEELAALFEKNQKREFNQVFESMVSACEIILLSGQIYWLADVYEKALMLVYKHFESHETLSLAECRDILATSRKYTLSLLEHLDAKKITKKQDDVRRLL